VIELAEEMKLLGWHCEFVCPADLLPADGNARRDYAEVLRRHLIDHGHEYDVVDYDHAHRPYPRDEFSTSTLFVPMSVLIARHFESISIPRERGAKGTVRAIIYRRSDNNLRAAETRRSHTTVEQSDLVNVANHDDKTELVRRGVPPQKIVVLPYGISRARRPAFDAVPSDPPSEPRVAFIG